MTYYYTCNNFNIVLTWKPSKDTKWDSSAHLVTRPESGLLDNLHKQHLRRQFRQQPHIYSWSQMYSTNTAPIYYIIHYVHLGSVLECSVLEYTRKYSFPIWWLLISVHLTKIRLLSVSHESPFLRKSCKTLFIVSLVCMQTTWIFFLYKQLVWATPVMCASWIVATPRLGWGLADLGTGVQFLAEETDRFFLSGKYPDFLPVPCGLQQGVPLGINWLGMWSWPFNST